MIDLVDEAETWDETAPSLVRVPEKGLAMISGSSHNVVVHTALSSNTFAKIQM